MAKAFQGKFRVTIISQTPIGPLDSEGHQYGQGVRVTLIPDELPTENPDYDNDAAFRGEVHLGVLSEAASKRFAVGQTFTLTLDAQA